MRLKVNDTEKFNLTLDLDIDYEHEFITAVVTFWDKERHSRTIKEFSADEFSMALACFRQYEEECLQDKDLQAKEHLLPWRIWHRYFNVDGEIISDGVSEKTYSRRCDAVRAAKKLYGSRICGWTCQWVVARTNPWGRDLGELPHGTESGIKEGTV